MQIFVTDMCPKIAAQDLDDRRVLKLILETAQLLGLAARQQGYGNCIIDPAPPKTIANHPLVKWVGKNRENYNWTREYFEALCKEYTLSSGKTHKWEMYKLGFWDAQRTVIPKGEMTPFVNLSHFNTGDITEDYKACLREKWDNSAVKLTWKRRTPPTWYVKAAA